MLNLRTSWDLQNQHKVSPWFQTGLQQCFNTWLILSWVHARVWSCCKAHGLCTSSELGKWRWDFSLDCAHPAQPSCRAIPRLRARAGCWEAAKFLGCCCLFYLLEPHKARQSQMDLGLVHVDCGAVLVLGTSSPETFPFPCKQTKQLSRGSPLPVTPQVSVPCPILCWDTHVGPWLLWGLIIQFCLQCWENLSLCWYTENSSFIFTCHYTTVLSEHAANTPLFFRASTSCCFSCQITGDICWSDHPH